MTKQRIYKIIGASFIGLATSLLYVLLVKAILGEINLIEALIVLVLATMLMSLKN